jgi:NAD(P)-dependent dehydrogenase (short-subunit alcohol dehydrogenase family)
MQADVAAHDPFSLRGKVALVTGGIRGIGAAVSRALAAAGAAVAVTSRPSPESQELRRALEGELAVSSVAGRSFGCDLEVRSQTSIDECVAAVAEHLGPIDVLVNNAGTNVQQDALEVDEATWDLILDTNLKGLFFTSQAVARRMCASPRAEEMGYSIINVASQMGLVGLSRRAAYCSSKAGVVNLTRVLAIEWAHYGIRVNAVAPTFIETPLSRPMLSDPTFRADIERRMPIGRVGDPSDIAGGVVYLASSAASFVTGHTLAIDGGWTAW